MGTSGNKNDETVLLRSEGVVVKSIPFEAILTDRRIVLIDRAKNVIPQRDISLESIQKIVSGENAILDPIITLYVLDKGNTPRQMVLTFSREGKGSRTRERDEWMTALESAFAPADEPEPEPLPLQKPIMETPPPIQTVSETPVQRATEPAPDSVFCIRCGNRVSADSAFCNKCGTPIVIPGRSSPQPAPVQPAPAPVLTPSPAAPRPVREESRPPATEPARVVQKEAGQPAQVRIPAAEPVVPPVIPAPQKTGRPAPQEKEARKKPGFFARLFAPRARAPPKQRSPDIADEDFSRKPARKGRSIKKILLALVAVVIVIAVVAAGALFVYPALSKGVASPGNSGTGAAPTPGTTPSSGSSSSQNAVLKADASWTPKITGQTPPATIPSAGVQVHVNYIGGWKGTYGAGTDSKTIQNSGDRVFEIVNATGPVHVSIAKSDSSTRHDILVELYKDGKQLTQGSTSAAYGSVTLAADVTSGVVQPAVTSAGSAATLAPAAGKTTAPPSSNSTAATP